MTTRSILRKRLVLAASIALAGILSALSLSAAPVTGAVFVAPSGDDNADCLSLATACRSVGVAISRAVAGDAVLIASGLYTDSFTIDKPLTLIGYGPTQPIIQGPGAPEPHRVITVSAGIDAAIQNLTIQHGDATSEAVPYGGGILNSGTLTLSYSTVAENQASDHGGGIANLEGTLYILESRIVTNHVFSNDFAPYATLYGGGIGVVSGTVTIRQSEIAGNLISPPYPFWVTYGCGGGIHNANGTVSIAGSRVDNNHADNLTDSGGIGGGICNSGRMVVERSEIFRNYAGSGIGIDNRGQLTLTQSSVSGECTGAVAANPVRSPSAPFIGDGAGILSHGILVVAMSAIYGNCFGIYDGLGGDIESTGWATLTNVTISNNFAYNVSALLGDFTLINVTVSGNRSTATPPNVGTSLAISGTMQNTLIANQGQNCADGWPFISLGHNLSSDASCVLSGTGDITNTDPRLGPLQDNGGGTPTNALMYGSPAIDAAGLAGCPATDQRGVPRPEGPACDIGAYEETLIRHALFPFVAR